MGFWQTRVRRWAGFTNGKTEPVIGVALGGGFARGIAHLGVLRVLERNNVPIRVLAGVSSGAIVASAYASGVAIPQIARAARSMRFTDVAQWKLNPLGLVESGKMEAFLRRLLLVHRFEDMRIPLAVVASDLTTGKPVIFRESGDVFLPIRASCSYPGLFQPVRHRDHFLIDGAMTMEVPAEAVRQIGATHVISVALPAGGGFDPRNLLQVINRSFQIMQERTERDWRRHSSLVIQPEVRGMSWDGFENAEKLIEAGERAARAALPRILSWLQEPDPQELDTSPAAA